MQSYTPSASEMEVDRKRREELQIKATKKSEQDKQRQSTALLSAAGSTSTTHGLDEPMLDISCLPPPSEGPL